MRQLLRWPKQELPSLSFMTLYGLCILSATGTGVAQSLGFLVLQVCIYAASVIGHEYAHLLSAKAFGVRAILQWEPRPTVTCRAMTIGAARVIAVAGPLAGTAISVAGLSALILIGKFSPLLYATAAACCLMHAAMLLPQFSDGRMLRTTFLMTKGQNI